MRTTSGRFVRALCLACGMLCMTSVLYAASPLVWEGEQVASFSGKAFKKIKLTGDPMGKVSGNWVVGIDKVEKGEKVAKDDVLYHVKIPATGTYYLWGRVRWSTGCGNSFLMNIAGVKGNWILGGDGTYEVLHWICLSDGPRQLALKLKKGTVDFKLSAKESGTMLDQFLLTTDAKMVPAGIYTTTPNLLLMPK
ncbi:MAG TPA: hypothetical protein VGL77_18265 [Armatimonadota bacterium]|jgi:hypothetical protein